jgi:chromobox protein 5
MSEKDAESNHATSDEEEESYEVEKIIKKRMKKGKVEYYVKWKGYGEAENTWEPEDNLECPDIVAAFEKNLDEEKPLKSAKKAPAPSSTASKRSRRSSETPQADGDADVEDVKEEPLSASAVKKPKPAVVPKKEYGFTRGLTAESVLGCTDRNGELQYLIKWTDKSEKEQLVPGLLCREHCASMLVAFLESRIQFPAAK